MAVDKPNPRVRRVQELRRSNAATPVPSKKAYVRTKEKQRVKTDIKDSPRT
jgi:hypothetical protein